MKNIKSVKINLELIFKIVFISLIVVSLGSLVIGLLLGEITTKPLN